MKSYAVIYQSSSGPAIFTATALDPASALRAFRINGDNYKATVLTVTALPCFRRVHKKFGNQ